MPAAPASLGQLPRAFSAWSWVQTRLCQPRAHRLQRRHVRDQVPNNEYGRVCVLRCRGLRVQLNALNLAMIRLDVMCLVVKMFD